MPASIPEFSVVGSFQLVAAYTHHCLRTLPHDLKKVLYGPCLLKVIVLIPARITMSQFVDKLRKAWRPAHAARRHTRRDAVPEALSF